MLGMIYPDPITAYLGVNGSGKSLSAIAFAIRDHERRGRPLITNMIGLSVDHIHIESVEELPDLMLDVATNYRSERTGKPLGMNVVLDEAGAMFSSRDASKEKKAFEKTVQQLRKYRARLLWTAPTFSRADKILREVSFMAVLCQPLVAKAVPDDPWPSTRLIVQKSFDVSRLDTSSTAMNRNAKTKGFGFVRTARWQDAFDSFATADGSIRSQPAAVESVGRRALRPGPAGGQAVAS